MPPTSQETYARIHAVVRDIPPGQVATYGQVAAAAGFPGRARQVGYALHSLSPGHAVPWQRVVNAQGRISLGGESGAHQRALLEGEGVEFDARGRIDLRRFGW